MNFGAFVRALSFSLGVFAKVFCLLLVHCLFSSIVFAEITIDLNVIKTIESEGNPRAVNIATRCYGLYQISEICLEDFNQTHQTRYAVKDLFEPKINEMIASWYFGRIKEMLRFYDIPITLTTLIATFNWGIGHVRAWYAKGMRTEGLPAETRGYIKKYSKLTRAD